MAVTAAILIGPLGAGFAWLWTHLTSHLKQDHEVCQKHLDELRHRLSALELLASPDVARWVTAQNGIVQSVTPAFVRLVGTTYGYTATDFVGKHLRELDRLPAAMLDALRDLKAAAASHGSAGRSGVPVGPLLSATVIKSCQASATGELVFVSVAAPEFGT